MKRFLMIVVVIIAIVMPAMTWAQEEGLSLEGLAEQMAALVSRVEVLESLYAPSAIMDSEGNCILAANGGLHPTTMAAYMGISDNQVPESPDIAMVKIVPGSGVLITINVDLWSDIYVQELWSGCEFKSHSRFWEEDYSGNRTWLE